MASFSNNTPFISSNHSQIASPILIPNKHRNLNSGWTEYLKSDWTREMLSHEITHNPCTFSPKIESNGLAQRHMELLDQRTCTRPLIKDSRCETLEKENKYCDLNVERRSLTNKDSFSDAKPPIKPSATHRFSKIPETKKKFGNKQQRRSVNKLNIIHLKQKHSRESSLCEKKNSKTKNRRKKNK